MEEKGFSILYYVILGAFFLYSFWKKRKSASDTSTPPPPIPSDDIEKQIREIFQPKPTKPSPATIQVNPKKSDPIKKSDSRKNNSKQSLYSSTSMLESVQQEGEKAVRIEASESQSEHDASSPEFDARAAIIASAILDKPVALQS